MSTFCTCVGDADNEEQKARDWKTWDEIEYRLEDGGGCTARSKCTVEAVWDSSRPTVHRPA